MLDTDVTEDGYHSHTSNVNSGGNSFMNSQKFNSRQTYINEFHKQPKSHNDVNCYQDNSIQYYNQDKIKRKKQFQPNTNKRNQEQYAIK